MKIAVSVWSLRDEVDAGKLDQLSALEVVAEMGAPGMELGENYFPDTSDAYLSKLTEKAKSLGITLCALGAHNAFTDPESDQGREQIEWTKKWLKIAAELGCGGLNVFTGKIVEGVDLETQKRWAVESFRRCLDTAEELKMPMALENHNQLAMTGDEMVWFIEQVGSPWLRGNPDPTNFTLPLLLSGKQWDDLTEEDLEMIYPATRKIAPYMVHAHMKHGRYTPDGEFEKVSAQRIIEIYREVNYQGYITLEWLGLGDARQSTTQGISLLSKYI